MSDAFFIKGNCFSIWFWNRVNTLSAKLGVFGLKDFSHGLGFQKAFLVFFFRLRFCRNCAAHRKRNVLCFCIVQNTADDYVEIKIPIGCEIAHCSAVQAPFCFLMLLNQFHGGDFWSASHTPVICSISVYMH